MTKMPQVISEGTGVERPWSDPEPLLNRVMFSSEESQFPPFHPLHSMSVTLKSYLLRKHTD